MMCDDPNVCDRCERRRDDIGMGGCLCPPLPAAPMVRFSFSVNDPRGQSIVSSDFSHVTGFDAVAAATAWCTERQHTRQSGYRISICIMEGADCRVVTADAEWHEERTSDPKAAARCATVTSERTPATADEIEAFVRRVLLTTTDNSTFTHTQAADRRFEVTTPSGVSACLSFAGWGSRCGAFFVLDSNWPRSAERATEDDLRRVRRAVATIALPTRNGRPLVRVTVEPAPPERLIMPESDFVWMRDIIERVVHVEEQWNGGTTRSFGILEGDVESYNWNTRALRAPSDHREQST